MSIERDQEEEEMLRQTTAEKDPPPGVKCVGLTLREMRAATYVILLHTENNFFVRGKSSQGKLAFDAAAFVWMHAAPWEEVVATDWQDQRYFAEAVTQWMAQFSGAQLLEMISTTKTLRDEFMLKNFPAPVPTKKRFPNRAA